MIVCAVAAARKRADCGCHDVSRKSRKARIKKFIDCNGKIHEIEVYRYYCRNPECDKGSFTNLPPNLVPYSPYTLDRHLLALQMYEWGGSNYRRCASALGISSATAYRWVSAFGHDLLSVSALFGVVRCSGVIGIDEKFVKVPKNDKPKSKMSRWMYVYVAVDCYTYDLLHIRIYAYRNEATARAFLLELRAKGYKPKAVVTDMWPQYHKLIGEVFPAATHQECIFHALNQVQKKTKEIYGQDYKKTASARLRAAEAVALKKQIYNIFNARTRRTAQKRFHEVMALRKDYVKQQPESEAIFVFLEKHWPRLIPAVESKIIPRTNNTAELVIRRFDQHYQNFCGFDSINSAQQYLAVFEKIYRFTPFSQDAQPRLRGKSPLEVAGYDISNMPMATICAGLSPQLSQKSTDLEMSEDAQEAFDVAIGG
ncbi:MAG: IS66 family transposase [Ardenticatenaceae bacterium]